MTGATDIHVDSFNSGRVWDRGLFEGVPKRKLEVVVSRERDDGLPGSFVGKVGSFVSGQGNERRWCKCSKPQNALQPRGASQRRTQG
jgi:hypothetical protein